MKKLLALTMLVMAMVLQVPAQTQVKEEPTVDFIDSMNAQVFTQINEERVQNGLPELKYDFVVQNTVDQIAEGLKTNFCHCYGEGNYVTENLYVAPSPDLLIADLAGYSKKNNPLKRKDIRYVSVGISDDNDHYYFAIRTF